MPAYSRILLPWDSQPQEVVDVNLDSQLARALGGVWSLGTGDFLDATRRNNGVLNAGVTRSVSALGRTLTFNGTSGNVTLPTPPAGTTLSGTDHSISLWLYPTNVTGLHGIFHQWNTSAGPIIFSNGTSLAWQVGGSGGRLTAFSAIAANVWQHFVFTYSASNGLAVYKNGVLFASSSPMTTNTAHTVAAVFGDGSVGGVGYFAGEMARPAFWTRELSATECKAEYEGPWNLFAPQSIPVPVSAGAPSSFIPAWAHRQTRTIGAGVI